MKGHPIFLEAAALVTKRRKETRFVCVGGGPEEYQANLQRLGESLGLADRLLWAGVRQDMPAVYNALDILVSSSSYGEGVSNAVGEAMASGIPCVVTNIGDSAWVVGDRGVVVPPKEPISLGNALERLLDHRPHTAAEIRLRIIEQLSVESLIVNTERALLSLSCDCPSAKPAF
jgi:glycosyltransferase involved in cell wall biosynthesis